MSHSLAAVVAGNISIGTFAALGCLAAIHSDATFVATVQAVICAANIGWAAFCILYRD